MPPLVTPRTAAGADHFMAEVEKLDFETLMGRGDKADEARAALATLQRERAHVALAAHRLFVTDEGRTVLEHLLDQTLRKTMCPPGLTRDARDDFISRREGENSLMRLLLSLIHEGANPRKVNHE
ncbi:MAG: hypothetical protein LCH61_18765 [Proteobacteria bacterium]|nr:hypothetical protein [Pseudomonadota bacterium]